MRPELIPNAYWVDDRLAAGAYPGAPDPAAAIDRLALLEAARLDAFVDLTTDEDALEPYAHLAPAARHLRHPIPDMGVTTVAGMAAALDAIDTARGDGLGVYVHCWGGIGRTGTVVGCWLVRHGQTPDEALALIGERRRDLEVTRRHPRSPQTDEQERFVRAWVPGR